MQASSNFFAGLVVAIGMVSLASVGCDDPAKGKSKATTTDTGATATSQAAVTTANAAQSTSKYSFDQTTSKVQWTGSKVTGKHDGSFAAFKGTVDVVDGAPEKSKVDVQIDTDSLTTDIEKLTGHLKSPAFFDVKAQPKATFVSKEIKKGGDKGATNTVTGDLTIKGITKSVTFPAAISVAGDAANVDAEFTINRRDFSLNYPGMPNDLIRDDVVVKLTIRAKKAS
jgi:polyisoprenoid-binding protein YceI